MGGGGYPDEEDSEDAFEGVAVTLQVCLASGQNVSWPCFLKENVGNREPIIDISKS